MKESAKNALLAAQIARNLGRASGKTFAARRGVPASLYRLACQLLADQGVQS